MATWPVRRFLMESADMEVDAVLGARPARMASTAQRVHKKLRLRATAVEPRGADSAEAKRRLTAAMIEAINEAGSRAIRRAASAFRAATSCDVNYMANASGEAFTFRFDQMPFMRGHGDALDLVAAIRAKADPLQAVALQAAVSLAAGRVAAMVVGSPVEEAWRARLTNEEAGQVASFVDLMEPGTIHPDALPVRVPVDAHADLLLAIAQAHSDLGIDMQLRPYEEIQGREFQRRRAARAWDAYGSCGVVLQVLAGWIRSLGAVDQRARCDICYRHVVTVCRCAEHATKTHETRAARLGKRVHPIYVRRAQALVRQQSVRQALDALHAPQGWLAVLESSVESCSADARVRMRASDLAHHLRAGLALFEPGRIELVAQLFGSLITEANRAIGAGPAASLEGERQRGRAAIEALTALSVKGFFSAWYGKPSSLHASGVPRLGFDQCHPVVRGGGHPTMIARDLVRQRAWEEAHERYVSGAMPGRSTLIGLAASGMPYRDIAQKFGVSYQTIHATLRRADGGRRRNRLP